MAPADTESYGANLMLTSVCKLVFNKAVRGTGNDQPGHGSAEFQNTNRSAWTI